MSRLDSFIRRLEAQRACLDAAARAIAELPGLVLELGLGNGRTFDHLRDRLPGRRIIVFERDPQPHPDCWPPEDDLVIGPLEQTLVEAARRWPAAAALIHSDIGTGDPARNRRVADALAQLLPPLLLPGGMVASDQELRAASLVPVPPPAGMAPDRYFLYRRGRARFDHIGIRREGDTSSEQWLSTGHRAENAQPMTSPPSTVPPSACPPFTMRFWGVRGTVPCPEGARQRYGGNTACIEIRCGEGRLIFDAGTGLRALGNEILATGDKRQSHIFFTHTHLDHIAGLPFFKPAYDGQNHFEFWAGHLRAHGLTLQHVLKQLMQPPLFPVPLDIMHACVSFHDFLPGEVLRPFANVVVRTLALNHPGGATGYRIECAGRSMCILTDVEHCGDAVDQDIVSFIRGADIVVYDCTYTDEEYARFVGWGHSTWQQGVRLCDAAGAGRLVAFHHDPEHDDDFMDEVARQMTRQRPGSLVAAEGLTLRP